jgi:hypothetical protein
VAQALAGAKNAGKSLFFIVPAKAGAVPAKAGATKIAVQKRQR